MFTPFAELFAFISLFISLIIVALLRCVRADLVLP